MKMNKEPSGSRTEFVYLLIQHYERKFCQKLMILSTVFTLECFSKRLYSVTPGVLQAPTAAAHAQSASQLCHPALACLHGTVRALRAWCSTDGASSSSGHGLTLLDAILATFGDLLATTRAAAALHDADADDDQVLDGLLMLVDAYGMFESALLVTKQSTLVQAQPAAPAADDDDGPAVDKHSTATGSGGLVNSYRMVLLEPVEGRWAPLPPLSWPSESLPLFCQVAAVDSAGGQGRKWLVVVGGWHLETWAPTDAVFIYDFLTGAWRRGTPMLGPRRSFFACAPVGGAVCVAGGHDDERNVLRSALAYDPDVNAWAQLPDMAEERDEPHGLCVTAGGGGRFLVGARDLSHKVWEVRVSKK
ncbi:uncharacterized protein [Miscanthus floridulus]|uniref:uncharacterized protein n=1 Tax=Miscanthus floridulus TaxID=154761 RepID=UPI0034577E3C